MELGRPSLTSAVSSRQGRLAAVIVLGPAIAALASTGCAEPPRCEPGSCPAGTRCDADTGQCEATTVATAVAGPQLRGAWFLLDAGGADSAAVGLDDARRSIGWWVRNDNNAAVQWLAGPAAGDDEPAGTLFAGTSTPTGAAAVAWVRTGDGAVMLSERKPQGWVRTVVPAIAPGTVHTAIAIAMWRQQPVIVCADAMPSRLRVVARQDDGSWSALPLDLAADLPSGHAPPAVAGSLSASGSSASLTVACHDRVNGELVVATRSTAWQVTRFPSAQANGSAGAVNALSRGSAGTVAVVWRDQSANTVQLARSAAGAVTTALVADGRYIVPDLGLERTATVGTALDVAVLPNGRAAVAWQDASSARVKVAVEGLGGTWHHAELPDNGLAQVRPRLLPRIDGSLVVGWLEWQVGRQGGRPMMSAIATPWGPSP